MKYSSTYVAEEREARQAKRGVFAAENVPPWEYRAAQWKPGEETRSADQARTCRIKGNISAKKVRIYHAPGQRDYERVRIDERRGEKWFCSEADAQTAGWRKAAR